MAQKRYLFTPGPTPVPPEVLAALAEPVLHHRAPDFREVYARVLGRLQEVYRTRSDVLLFTCSGTGGLRVRDRQPLLAAASACSSSPSGYFGERWAAMAQTLRLRGRGAALRVGRDADGRRPRAAGSASSSRSRSSSSCTRRRRPASSPTCGRSPPPRRTPARSSSSTRSRASAPCRSRRTSGGSTWSSRARRRR